MSQNFGFVILSFNHPQITARAINQCLKHVPNEQILLYHNGSDPRFVDELKTIFPQILHFVGSKNSGFSGGANRALESAFQKWSWVFFMTHDTELLKLDPNFTAPPGLYAPLIWDRQKSQWDSFGGAFEITRAHLRHLRSDSDGLNRAEKFYVPGTAFLIHRTIFETLTGFNESLGTFWEDVDFSLRCGKKSLPLGGTRAFEVLYHGGKIRHHDVHYSLYLYQKNRWRVAWNYIQRENLWWHLPSLALVFAFDFVRLSSRLLAQKRWKDWTLLGRAFAQM